jgi:hypothetical protein
MGSDGVFFVTFINTSTRLNKYRDMNVLTARGRLCIREFNKYKKSATWGAEILKSVGKTMTRH